ncbi:MAG TPA: ATP-binding protein [Anaeromyxobacteraceae bacterium]|nr:ATP-binding protein [Anaeromyxobacteraceae bacterium]
MPVSELKPRRPLAWIVDDNPLEREHARRALGDEFVTESFVDGSAVLERLANGAAPDVLVLDWLMPGVSGIDVCKYLRSSPATVETAVLLMTAQRETAHVVEGLRAGANDYLTKPYAAEELRARAGALVRSKALRERAEEAEAFLRTLLASLPDAVLLVNPAGQVSFANDQAMRILAPDGRAIVGREVGAVVPGIQLDARNEDGVLPDVHVGADVFEPRVRPLLAEAGMSMTVSLRKVTEKRRREARRLDFYSMVAHDLRSPLSAMLMRVDWLLAGRRGALQPEVRSDVQKIEARIRDLVTLLNDFLDLARMESMGLVVTPQAIDMNELVRASVEEHAPLAAASNLDLRSECCPDQACVDADRPRIAQVLSNLLSNAIKFTPRGGRIVARVTVDAECVETCVEDTGRGIAPDVVPNLFRRYERGPQLSDDVMGTGLGLMIVREIVEAHSGSIDIRSELGRGTAITFTLRRVAACASAAEGA